MTEMGSLIEAGRMQRKGRWVENYRKVSKRNRYLIPSTYEHMPPIMQPNHQSLFSTVYLPFRPTSTFQVETGNKNGLKVIRPGNVKQPNSWLDNIQQVQPLQPEHELVQARKDVLYVCTYL